VPKVLHLHGTPQNLIGRRIALRDHDFTVVGVLQPAERFELIRTDMDQAIFIPYGNAMRMDFHGRIDQLTARSGPAADPAACERDVMQYFYRRAPGIQVEVTTAEQLIAQMRKQSDMLAAMLAAIASISLVVGGVGIMNILLVSVSERRQEIGIRRALGACQADIRYQFLFEAVLLSMIGGLLGIVIGVAASWLVSRSQGWVFFVSVGTLVMGVGVSMAIGVFFGFFPAHQAAKMDPITALRGE
jgi:putative ABC transport system permease protein